MRWLLAPLRDAGVRFVVLAVFTVPLFAAMQWAMHHSGGGELLASQRPRPVTTAARLGVTHDGGALWQYGVPLSDVWLFGVLLVGAIVVVGVVVLRSHIRGRA